MATTTLTKLTFKSKSKHPFMNEKNGPLYEGFNFMFECDKRYFNYDEAWETCNEMIENMKETEGYDIGFINRQYFNYFGYKFGVLFGRKVEGDN